MAHAAAWQNPEEDHLKGFPIAEWLQFFQIRTWPLIQILKIVPQILKMVALTRGLGPKNSSPDPKNGCPSPKNSSPSPKAGCELSLCFTMAFARGATHILKMVPQVLKMVAHILKIVPQVLKIVVTLVSLGPRP